MRALRDQPQEESAVAPLQASRFNPIYVEPGSIQINSTKDLQTLYPNSFDRISDMSGEYDIKIDPHVYTCTAWEMQGTYQIQSWNWKRIEWHGPSRNNCKTNRANTMGKLTDVSKETQW